MEEQEKVLMGQRELKRWQLMKMVEVGKITLREAEEKIGVSYRQAKRIGRAIRERGIKGLVHGNRGRPSNNRLKEALRERSNGSSIFEPRRLVVGESIKFGVGGKIF